MSVSRSGLALPAGVLAAVILPIVLAARDGLEGTRASIGDLLAAVAVGVSVTLGWPVLRTIR